MCPCGPSPEVLDGHSSMITRHIHWGAADTWRLIRIRIHSCLLDSSSPPLTAAAPVRPSCSRSWTENTEWMREMKWDLMKPWPGLELVYSPELTSLSPVALDLVSCGLDMKKAVKLPFLIYILKDFTHRKMYFKCSLASLRQCSPGFISL